jgi:MarR family transcriptional regulator, lower aerobic nicotinate degradation pathway regulator
MCSIIPLTNASEGYAIPVASVKPETRQPSLPRPLRDSTSFLLKRLGYAAKERATEAFEETGLGPYHYAVLLALDEGSHETQGAIADALGYDRGQMVGLLDELEERGFVERQRDPADRRRQLVSTTPAGAEELKRLRALTKGLDEELFGPLPAAEREQLHDLLLRLGEAHLPIFGGRKLGS